MRKLSYSMLILLLAIGSLVGAGTVAYADATGLTITSPTTASPASVSPGETVDITYQITVDRLDQVVDRQVSILTTPEISVNPSVVSAPLSANTFTVTTTVTVPLGTVSGTYDVRVRVRQPATGGWEQVVTNAGAVIIGSPVPPAEPLSITAPEDITVEGNTTGGATDVTLGDPTVYGGTPPYNVTNDALSFFPLGDTVVTWTVTDADDNTASDTQTVTVVDTTPPTITAVNSVTIVVGAPSSVLLPPTVSDIVDPSPTVTNDAPSTFLLGITVVTWTATDASGNSATATTTVTAVYNFGGFLPPLGPGPSAFKTGSTIPVKFQLTDYGGTPVSTASGTASIAGISADCRYDATDMQYIANLKTPKTAAPGSYTITLALNDGTSHEISVTLK